MWGSDAFRGKIFWAPRPRFNTRIIGIPPRRKQRRATGLKCGYKSVARNATETDKIRGVNSSLRTLTKGMIRKNGSRRTICFRFRMHSEAHIVVGLAAMIGNKTL